MPDTNVLPDHPGGNLCTQLFFGVGGGAEGTELPIQAIRVPCPVPQLMQCRCIILVGLCEAGFGRQVDFITRRAIECPVTLIVPDDSAGIGQNSFSLLLGIPGKGLLLLRDRREVFHLCRVKNASHAKNGPCQFYRLTNGCTVISQDRLSIFVHFVLLAGELVVDDRRGATALFDAVASIIGLLQRHPAWISIALHGKMQAVDPTINCPGQRIARSHVLGGRPGLLPRRGSLFQHLDDFLRELLMERNPILFICGHHPLPAPQAGRRPSLLPVSEHLP